MLHPSAVGNFIRKISVEPARPPLGPIRVLVGEFGRSARRYHVKKMRVNSCQQEIPLMVVQADAAINLCCCNYTGF